MGHVFDHVSNDDDDAIGNNTRYQNIIISDGDVLIDILSHCQSCVVKFFRHACGHSSYTEYHRKQHTSMEI